MPLPKPYNVECEDVEGKEMLIYEYEFEDGEIYKLVNKSFSVADLVALKNLHGHKIRFGRRWICCQMCDKKRCEWDADDCDVKGLLKNKDSEDKG